MQINHHIKRIFWAIGIPALFIIVVSLGIIWKAGFLTHSLQGGVRYWSPGYLFMFEHPKDWTIDDKRLLAPWENGAMMKLPEAVRVAAPESWRAGTNFAEAGIDFIVSDNTKAVAECAAPPDFADTHISKKVGGINFEQFTQNGAGAGNFYGITSYRGISDGKCYVADLYIHSSNIGNYDPSQGIKEFDKIAVTNALESVFETFRVFPLTKFVENTK